MSNPTKPTQSKTLTAKEACTYTGLSLSTLNKMRAKGIGARYLKIGEGRNSKVLYPIAELDKFLANKLQATA